MNTAIEVQVLVGLVVIGQAVFALLFWGFRGKMKEEMAAMETRIYEHMDKAYVRTGECVLRDGSTREVLRGQQRDAAAACLAAASRDEVTQRRIDDVIAAIAAQTAAIMLRDQELVAKIKDLLR